MTLGVQEWSILSVVKIVVMCTDKDVNVLYDWINHSGSFTLNDTEKQISQLQLEEVCVCRRGDKNVVVSFKGVGGTKEKECFRVGLLNITIAYFEYDFLKYSLWI